MRIQLTLTALNELAEVEGSVDEIVQLISALATSKTPIKTTVVPSTARPTLVPRIQVIGPSTTPSSGKKPKERSLKMTDNFVEAIYLYEPNPAADSGRGAYIATQIVKGKSLNIDDLAKRAQGRRQTVYNAVRRMRENGAIIDMTRTSVKLISLPDPPYAAKGYEVDSSPAAKVASSKTTKTDTDIANKLLSSLSNIRLA